MSANSPARSILGALSRPLALAGVAALTAATLAFVSAPDARAGGGPGCGGRAPGLVVHEWGTFTSMQGSSGVTLEGLHHEEEGLPAFVHARSSGRGLAPMRQQGKGLEFAVSRVTEKMETPVTYFYSDRPLSLHAGVQFERGLLSQWFPSADFTGPAIPKEEGATLDMSKVEASRLDWAIDVRPRGEGLDEIPAVEAGDPWAFARLPDSNVVRVTREHGSAENEKFLFYRGLGTFDLPVQAVTGEGGVVTIKNGGERPIRHVFLLNVRGGRAVWTYVPEVAARGAVALAAPLDGGPEGSPAPAPEGSLDHVVEGLRAALEDRLVRCGLFPKEAEAMTRTWERSYFRTEGLRVLYVVPEETVSDVLPLDIYPRPEKVVRVLVGRLECVAPEVEREVAAALVGRRSADEGARARSQARLARLGRFLEPHVRDVIGLPALSGSHEAAKQMLAEIGAE